MLFVNQKNGALGHDIVAVEEGEEEFVSQNSNQWEKLDVGEHKNVLASPHRKKNLGPDQDPNPQEEKVNSEKGDLYHSHYFQKEPSPSSRVIFG